MSASPRSIDASGVSGQAPAGLRRIDKLVEQAALVMMPTGFIFIILGWMGASKTPLMFEQIPYLISGGLLGVGLMVGGGLLYVGGWIARTAQLVPRETVSPALLAALAGSAQAAPGTAAPVGAFVKTPTGSMFHRIDCSIVAGRTDVLAVSAKDLDQYRPCGMCDPQAA